MFVESAIKLNADLSDSKTSKYSFIVTFIVYYGGDSNSTNQETI
jgi:hypothetical protein